MVRENHPISLNRNPNGAKLLTEDDMKPVMSHVFISSSERQVYEVKVQSDCSTGQLCSSGSGPGMSTGGALAPVGPGTFEGK